MALNEDVVNFDEDDPLIGVDRLKTKKPIRPPQSWAGRMHELRPKLIEPLIGSHAVALMEGRIVGVDERLRTDASGKNSPNEANSRSMDVADLAVVPVAALEPTCNGVVIALPLGRVTDRATSNALI